jgi:phosphate uptake regulator
MAISPKQAKEKLYQSFADMVKDAEKKIDQMLADGRRAFATKDMRVEAIREIINLYKAQGWAVELVTDWRDGNYLQFSVPEGGRPRE